MAISKKRESLTETIVEKVAKYLDENPGDSRTIALAAVRSFCHQLPYSKMEGVNSLLEYWLNDLGQKAEAERTDDLRN